MILKVDGKASLIDFDGRTIISPKYDEISGIERPLYSVYRIVDDDCKLAGLVSPNGVEILEPTFKQISFCKDGKHLICVDENGCTMMLLTIK